MSDRQRDYSSRWRRTRRRYLRTHPMCEAVGCNAPATDVHHLDGKGPRGPHGHAPFNLQALCRSCHSRVTANSRPKRRRPPEQHPGLIE